MRPTRRPQGPPPAFVADDNAVLSNDVDHAAHGELPDHPPVDGHHDEPGSHLVELGPVPGEDLDEGGAQVQVTRQPDDDHRTAAARLDAGQRRLEHRRRGEEQAPVRLQHHHLVCGQLGGRVDLEQVPVDVEHLA
ncbi:MAG: hypothetical protein MUD05_11605, partial [Candidatus Nanopelagicales bacterium]|nr:hypothetical protein [Candidatus Nanopelagicales bacterium]